MRIVFVQERNETSPGLGTDCQRISSSELSVDESKSSSSSSDVDDDDEDE